MLMEAPSYGITPSALPIPVDPSILLAEQEHRTQNVLQLIAGLLARAADAEDGEVAATLRAVEAQVHSFGLLDAVLSTRGAYRAETACCVTFLERLCAHLEAACLASRGIAMVFSAEPGMQLDERTCRHLGLAVTEAVLNAIKHAFDGAGGSIRVVIDQAADRLRVAIEDDGRGMTGRARADGRGLRFIERLLDSVGGSVVLAAPRRGTRVELSVPRSSHAGAGR